MIPALHGGRALCLCSAGSRCGPPKHQQSNRAPVVLAHVLPICLFMAAAKAAAVCHLHRLVRNLEPAFCCSIQQSVFGIHTLPALPPVV